MCKFDLFPRDILKKHSCTWPLDNVTTIWSLFSDKLLYYVSRKNIFDEHIECMYDFFKTGHFLVRTEWETMILSFLKFIHTYTLTHCYTFTKKLGKRQRHGKWGSWGLLFYNIQQFNEMIITYPRMYVDLQREMSNRKSSAWKIGAIFLLYSLKYSPTKAIHC